MNISVEKFSLKNLVAFSCAVLVIVILLVNVIVASYSDIINYFFAPFEFDLYQAIIDKPRIILDLNTTEKQGNDAFTGLNGEDLFRKAYESSGLDRRFEVSSEQALLYDAKFNQFGKYIFKIKPDEIYDLGLEYETTLYSNGITIAKDYTHKYILCQLDNTIFFAKVPYNYVIKEDEILKGVFLPFPEPTIRDIKKAFGGNGYLNSLFGYQFDTTLDFSYERLASVIWSAICVLIIVFLLIKLIKQITFFEKRPLYKKIDLLNGDTEIINEQLKNAEFVDKSYITKDWVITPKLFRTKITRNVSERGDY